MSASLIVVIDVIREEKEVVVVGGLGVQGRLLRVDVSRAHRVHPVPAVVRVAVPRRPGRRLVDGAARNHLLRENEHNLPMYSEGRERETDLNEQENEGFGRRLFSFRMRGHCGEEAGDAHDAGPDGPEDPVGSHCMLAKLVMAPQRHSVESRITWYLQELEKQRENN